MCFAFIQECLDEAYKSPIQIPHIGVEDDRSSLGSSGSLRNSFNALTTKGNFSFSTYYLCKMSLFALIFAFPK